MYTPVGLQSERPMCLRVSDLMTPLTALIHTQVLVHIFEKITRTEILQTENHLCQSDRRCLTWFDPSSGLKLNFVDALVQRASFGNVVH